MHPASETDKHSISVQRHFLSFCLPQPAVWSTADIADQFIVPLLGSPSLHSLLQRKGDCLMLDSKQVSVLLCRLTQLLDSRIPRLTLHLQWQRSRSNCGSSGWVRCKKYIKLAQTLQNSRTISCRLHVSRRSAAMGIKNLLEQIKQTRSKRSKVKTAGCLCWDASVQDSPELDDS